MINEILFTALTIYTMLAFWIAKNYDRIRKENNTLKISYEMLLSQKKSSEVRLGQISEQLAPMLDGFNYDPKKAHFIGNPIDYVIFEDDKIVFLEVKSGESRMNKKQRDIKTMIENGKVEFDTMKIK